MTAVNNMSSQGAELQLLFFVRDLRLMSGNFRFRHIYFFYTQGCDSFVRNFKSTVMKKSIFILTALILVISQSTASVFKGHLLFTAKLDGAQVVPAVPSNANGVASLMLNKTRD